MPYLERSPALHTRRLGLGDAGLELGDRVLAARSRLAQRRLLVPDRVDVRLEVDGLGLVTRRVRSQATASQRPPHPRLTGNSTPPSSGADTPVPIHREEGRAQRLAPSSSRILPSI